LNVTDTAQQTPQRARAARDPRLDFFRGLAMCIILVSHITNNPWALWIHGRFGFSDAADIFVFCSGMASALAFGALFHRAGWALGTLRILHRMWQVYWAHIGVFFVTLWSMVALTRSGWFEIDYVDALNLYPFLNSTGANLIGLLTLTYVPNFFDILPMYLVLLAMVPVAMLLARVHVALPVLASVTLWAYGNAGALDLPAEYWFPAGSTRPWFFNPFCWQLLFFTGFGLMAGWLPVPPVRRGLVIIAALLVLATVPLAWGPVIGAFEVLRQWRQDWVFLYVKTDYGVLRYLHFLCLAYLAWVAVGPQGVRLQAARLAWIVRILTRIGQQSLAVFMVSVVLSRLLGVALDVTGRGVLATAAINLAGFALLFAAAEIARFFKSSPWRVATPLPPRPAVPAVSTLAEISKVTS
jgi:hypothetical protein